MADFFAARCNGAAGLLAAMIGVIPIAAQSPSPALPDYVASIKPISPATCCGKSFNVPRDGNTVTIKGATLKDLIKLAFGLPSNLIVGGPQWLNDNQYDVDAKAEGKASQDERVAMLKALLIERSKLAFH